MGASNYEKFKSDGTMAGNMQNVLQVVEFLTKQK